MKTMMIDLGNQRGSLSFSNIIDTPTSVDCAREVRFRRSLRSFVECMVPACCTAFQPPHHHLPSDATTLTGTFFGYRKGRVSFCLQDNTRTTTPLLLLEFAVPTAYLAREMQYGLLRIALECHRHNDDPHRSLFHVPVWSLYCNGRKVGFAIRRKVTVADLNVLQLMHSVSVGAGVLPPPQSNSKSSEEDGELMYLRASFKRVIGSVDSESFHMINPVGSSGQELSIFLLRS